MDRVPQIRRFPLRVQSMFIDPRWMNRRHHRELCFVGEDGSVVLEGKGLKFVPIEDQELPSPGTQVYISIDRNFYAEIVSEVEAYNAFREARQREERVSYDTRLNQLRDEAIAFNATLRLPFQWQPQIKPVISGLTENSWGDGTNRATVAHIQLLEDYQNKALKRKCSEFLCTTDRGRFSDLAQDKPATNVDGEGKEYLGRITCKTCLRRAKGLMRTSKIEAV